MPHYTRQDRMRIPAEALLGVWLVYHHYHTTTIIAINQLFNVLNTVMKRKLCSFLCHVTQACKLVLYVCIQGSSSFFKKISPVTCITATSTVSTRLILLYLKLNTKYTYYSSLDMLMISHTKTRFISFIIVSRLGSTLLDCQSQNKNPWVSSQGKLIGGFMYFAWWYDDDDKGQATWNYTFLTMILYCIVRPPTR